MTNKQTNKQTDQVDFFFWFWIRSGLRLEKYFLWNKKRGNYSCFGLFSQTKQERVLFWWQTSKQTNRPSWFFFLVLDKTRPSAGITWTEKSVENQKWQKHKIVPAKGRVLSRTRKKNQLGPSVCLFVCHQKSTLPCLVWEKSLKHESFPRFLFQRKYFSS